MPTALNRTSCVMVRYRPRERRVIEAAARVAGERVAEFVRRASLRAAALTLNETAGNGRNGERVRQA